MKDTFQNPPAKSELLEPVVRAGERSKNVLKRLFGPLGASVSFWLIVASLIAGTMTVWDYKTASLSSRAGDETAYFASELQNEAGPELEDYQNAATLLGDLLDTHLKSLKARPFYSLYSRRFSAVALDDSLAHATELLRRDFRSVEDGSNAVANAAAALRQYVTNVWVGISEQDPKYKARQSTVTPELSKETQLAFSSFHAAVANFDTNSLETSRLASIKKNCELSRKAGGLFQIVWPEVQAKVEWREFITQFEKDLVATQAHMNSFLKDFPKSQSADCVGHYLSSVSRRLFALQSINAENFAKLRFRLMNEVGPRASTSH